MEFDGASLAELTIAAKVNDAFESLSKAITNFIPLSGTGGYWANALVNGFKVVLGSIRVNTAAKVSALLDQVDFVSEAYVDLFDGYSSLLQRTLDKLDPAWGEDLLVSRIVHPNSGVVTGLEFSEEFRGSEASDTVELMHNKPIEPFAIAGSGH